MRRYKIVHNSNKISPVVMEDEKGELVRIEDVKARIRKAIDEGERCGDWIEEGLLTILNELN